MPPTLFLYQVSQPGTTDPVYGTTPSQMRALLSSYSTQMVPQEPLVAWQKTLVIFVLVSLPVLLSYTSWESYLGQG